MLYTVKKTDKRKIIFILSADHSGSTWVGYVLGSQKGTTFLGEFYREWTLGLEQPCTTCSAKGFSECKVLRNIKDVPVTQAFNWAFNCTGNRVLVDSSKVLDWPGRSTIELHDVQIQLVHLIRDPRGWFASYQRRTPEINLETMLLQWLRVNSDILTYATIQALPCTTAFYEDLAGNPTRHFGKLANCLGLHFNRSTLEYWRYEHHGFAGNGATSLTIPETPSNVKLSHFTTGDDSFYSANRRRLFLDTRWKQQLSEDIQKQICENSEIQAFLRRFEKRMTDTGLENI